MSDGWIAAREVRNLVAKGREFSSEDMRAIRVRANFGEIRTKTRSFLYENVNERRVQENCILPSFFWALSDFGEFHQDWLYGDFSAKINSQISCYAIDVEFEHSGIETMMSAFRDGAVEVTPVEAIARAITGRPAATNWESVLIALAKDLYVGDLQPKRQADLERAVAEYLTRKGQSVADSTIRSHVAPLWRAIESAR